MQRRLNSVVRREHTVGSTREALMSLEFLSMVIGFILEVGRESATPRIDRSEAINRLCQRLHIDREPANDFESVYVHALIEYGTFKPEPILNFFRHQFVREAFRQSFYDNNRAILENEAEGVIQWNEETGKLGQIDYDPRREFAEFTRTFNEIVDRIRTPTEVRQDRRLDELRRSMDEFREVLIKGLHLDRAFSKLPTEDALDTVAEDIGEPEWRRGPEIYRLELSQDIEQVKAALSDWRIVTTSARFPAATVANGIIGVGQNDGVTFNLSPVAPISNCSAECELRIIDHGTDRSNWAGIRVRAFDFCYDFRLGYLIYMRRSGSVELYGPEGIIAGFGQVRVQDTRDAWTHLRVDVLDHEIRVYINGELHLQSKDDTFGGKGRIYLHTFGTHSQFRNFRVYELENRS
jgi:hypothetical protein